VTKLNILINYSRPLPPTREKYKPPALKIITLAVMMTLIIVTGKICAHTANTGLQMDLRDLRRMLFERLPVFFGLKQDNPPVAAEQE
jgi:hypothetical protein